MLTLRASALATAVAIGLVLPDPRLTPGAAATTNKAEICAHPEVRGSWYSRTHRVWRDKAETLRRYGIPPSRAREFEDDDLIPVCLGGDNASPLNHWPQPWPQARLKDRVEARMCRAVCAGEISVPAAQEYFRRLEWTGFPPRKHR